MKKYQECLVDKNALSGVMEATENFEKLLAAHSDLSLSWAYMTSNTFCIATFVTFIFFNSSPRKIYVLIFPCSCRSRICPAFAINVDPGQLASSEAN